MSERHHYSSTKPNPSEKLVILLEDKNIHHVPVVSGDKVIGMLSKVDLQKISFRK